MNEAQTNEREQPIRFSSPSPPLSSLVRSLAEALDAARAQVAEAQEREIAARVELADERRENNARAERGRAALAQCEAERDALKKRLLLLDATDRSMGELLIEMEAERDALLPVVNAAVAWAKNLWEVPALRNAVWAYNQRQDAPTP